jgi:hypothetical protein
LPGLLLYRQMNRQKFKNIHRNHKKHFHPFSFSGNEVSLMQIFLYRIADGLIYQVALLALIFLLITEQYLFPQTIFYEYAST